MFISRVVGAATGGYIEVTNKMFVSRVFGAGTGGYLEVSVLHVLYDHVYLIISTIPIYFIKYITSYKDLLLYLNLFIKSFHAWIQPQFVRNPA